MAHDHESTDDFDATCRPCRDGWDAAFAAAQCAYRESEFAPGFGDETATGYVPGIGEHVFCYRPSDGETRCGFVDDNKMGLFLTSCRGGRVVLTAARWNVQPMAPTDSCRTEGKR
ncbi:hypothetical protein ACFW5U_36250 [Streptomyces rochei]|uniref:hypothetical protein n=1 Tax=Streptomyces rochei TaxID=1928 RepID=UPI003683B3F6